MEDLKEKYEKELIEERRKFRRLAEVGWLEMMTTIEIIKYLKNLGFEIHYGKEIHTNRMGLPTKDEFKNHINEFNIDKIETDFDKTEILEGYTGCIAKMKSKKPGKNYVLRFDIDALPFHETNDKKHIPNIENFRSIDENTVHACGHDGHISIGLLTAKYISENINNLTGSYTIIFQPAEEGVRGAKSIVDTLFLDNADYLIGSHIGMNEKENILGVGSKGFLATSKFDVVYKGITSHAGNSPEKGKNALLAAASCVLNLHNIPQYGEGISRVNVGFFEAGNGRNVVAQDALFKYELRSDKKEILDDLIKRANSIVKYSALAYDLEYNIKEVGSATTFISSHEEFLIDLADELRTKGFTINKFPKLSGSEDISYMLDKVEKHGGVGIHFIFGTNLKAPHHNDAFDYDEDVLFFGFNAIVETIKYLNKLN